MFILLLPIFSKKNLNYSIVIEVFSVLAKKATAGLSMESILLSSKDVSELDLDLIFGFFLSG